MLSTNNRFARGGRVRRLGLVALGLVPLLVIAACSEETDPPIENEEYAISGTVLDVADMPLAGVTIGFSGGFAAVETGADGAWSKSALRGDVIVTASSDGWTFLPATITVNGPRADVNFVGSDGTIEQYSVAVSADPQHGGTVTGGGQYFAGSMVTVSAAPSAGYGFVRWTQGGAEASTSSSYSFAIEGDRVLVGHFEEGSFSTFSTDVTITGGADSGDRFSGSRTAGNLIADAMRSETGADAALFPSVNMRHGVDIAPGTFSADDLLALYALHIENNHVVVADISAADLGALLLSRSQTHNNVSEQVSGITYTILTHANGQVRRVLLADASGNSIDPTRTLTVAFSSHSYENHYAVDELVENKRETTEKEKEFLLGYVASFTTPIPASLADERISIELDPEQDGPFGVTEVELTAGAASADRFTGSSTAANLITDAIRAHTGADFSTINSTAMSAGTAIEPGSFSESDLLALYSQHVGTNKAIAGDVLGSDLVALVLARSQRHNNADVQVSGFTYDIILDAQGEAVAVNVFDGQGNSINPAATYRVSFNSHNFQHYGLEGKIGNMEETVLTEKEMLLDYVEGLEGPIPASLGEPRIRLLPANG